jgi:predicted RNase H-like nuclease (RuvC/YqgF family)
MERDDAKPHDYALYLAVDQKIDKMKDQVSELFQKDHANKERIENLDNRLNLGVAQTGRENSAKLTELALKLNDMQHELAGEKSTVTQLEKVLGRIMAGIFWVSFTGIVGGLLAVAYQILRVRLLGG